MGLWLPPGSFGWTSLATVADLWDAAPENWGRVDSLTNFKQTRTATVEGL
jgi:hypothetical protein